MKTAQLTVQRETRGVFAVLRQGIAAVFLYVCLAAMTIGCFYIYSDVFGTITWMGGVAVVRAWVILWAAYYFLPFLQGSDRRHIPLAVLDVIVIIAFATGFLQNKAEIFAGFRVLGNAVFEKWNEYYGIWLPLLETESVSEGSVQAAMSFFLLLIFWWELFCVLRWKKAVPAILPGVLLLALDLLVGYAPETGGVLFFAFGSFGIVPFCQSGYRRKGENDRGRTMAFRGSSGLLLVIGLVCTVLVTWIFARGKVALVDEYQGKLAAYQRGLEDRILEWDFWSIFDGGAGRISNRAPEYTGKEVITVSMTELPADTLYLRGYVGDTYQGGNWANTSQRDFAGAVEAWPENIREDAGEQILNMAYEAGMQSASAVEVSYEITFLDTGDDYAYLPYFVDLDRTTGAAEDAKELSYVADAYVLRNGNEALATKGIKGISVGEIGFYQAQEAEEVTELYVDYASRYLEVPDGLTQIAALGEELAETMESEYGAYFQDAVQSSNGLGREVVAVYLVRQAIFERTSYSLNLSSLPLGEDVVEYFLFDSGKGFCQHYASAGALLLREMGIPARYVTGYVVQPDMFAMDAAGNYVTAVKDEQAHAWVEIYVEGMGWIPVEMTERQKSDWNGVDFFRTADGEQVVLISPYEDVDVFRVYAKQGASSENMEESDLMALEEYLNRAQDLAQEDQIAEDEGEEEEAAANEEGAAGEDKAGEEAEDEDEEIVSQTQETEISSQNTETEDANRQQKDAAGSGGNYNAGNPSSQAGNDRAVLGIVIALLVLAAASALAWVKFRKESGRKTFVQKSHRRAVRGISERIYRLLRRRGILPFRDIDDSAFREILREKLDMLDSGELEQYFSVIERAAFDREDVSGEDVRLCYNLYRKMKVLKLK